MKRIQFVLMIMMAVCLCSCSDRKKDVIEYGTEVKLEDYFSLQEGETLSSDINIDSKLIGVYEVKATITGSDQTTREENKQLRVEDHHPAEIQLMQSTQFIYEIPFQGEFNPIGNIDKIMDETDGEYTEIDLVSSEAYDAELAQVKELKESMESQIFQTNEQIAESKNNRRRSGYTLLNSQVNVEQAGIYTIRLSAIDHSYNITEKHYQVRVLKEGQAPSEGKLASGAQGSEMGNALSYTVIQREDEAAVEPIAPSVAPSSSIDNGFVSQGDMSSADTIDAQGSPVLQAALHYVGSHMYCDQLATMALVDGGYLTGTPERVFIDGDYYNIGVYQMPALGSYISAAEAVPGDLILYDDGGSGSMHVAVYAGNEKAVHGGYNGDNVVVTTVYLGSGPRYFRVEPMTWYDVSVKVFGESFANTGDDIDKNDEPLFPDRDDVFDRDDEDIQIDQSVTYSGTYSLDDITVNVTSNTPIDGDFVFTQIRKVATGEITMEQLTAILAEKGYTISN